jgi:hypothetical protein
LLLGKEKTSMRNNASQPSTNKNEKQITTDKENTDIYKGA